MSRIQATVGPTVGTFSGHGLIWMAVLAATAAALGLWQLGSQPLWFDESLSARAATLPLSTIVSIVQVDPFNSLYYPVLHVWQIAGGSETWLRSLSVICGVATILTLFAFQVRLFNLRVAVLSCALLIVNLFFLRYMQEARSYSLALFLVVAASWCFVGTLDRPSTGRWVAYAVTSALAIHAHAFTAFVIASHAVSLFFRPGRPALGAAGSYLLVAALVAPLVGSVLAADPLQRSFVPLPTLDSIKSVFLHLTGGGGVPSRNAHVLVLLYFVACCGALIAMAREYRRRGTSPQRWSNTFVLLWFGVPLLTTFLLSFANPMFYPRYLIFVLPAMVTIAGIGISSLPSRPLRVLAVGAFAALSVSPLRSYYGTSVREGGDWRAATAYIAREDQAGDDIVFLSRYGRGPFEYYRAKSPADVAVAPLYPRHPWGATALMGGYRDVEPTATAAERLRQARRVWTFLVWGGFDSKAEDATPIRQVLEDEFTLVTRQWFGPSLEVRLYARD